MPRKRLKLFKISSKLSQIGNHDERKTKMSSLKKNKKTIIVGFLRTLISPTQKMLSNQKNLLHQKDKNKYLKVDKVVENLKKLNLNLSSSKMNSRI